MNTSERTDLLSMSADQLAAYGNADTVYSDGFGLISRDNRNHRKKAEIILQYLDVPDGAAILEVGCGAGLHTKEYTDRYDVTAVDLSPTLVKQTKIKAPDANAVVMDASDTSFADDQFAAVVGSAILHHLSNQSEALREWRRVTRPSGQILLLEPNYLFPKDCLSAHLFTEERHKTQMAPWRLRKTLHQVSNVHWQVVPRIYTPPWPARLSNTYDWIDAKMSTTPVFRWLSQLLLIRGRVC